MIAHELARVLRARIEWNNQPGATDAEDRARREGRVQAYEDVLRLIGEDR